ncbi:hypothetical protein [Streptomyces sp. NPDC054961]
MRRPDRRQHWGPPSGPPPELLFSPACGPLDGERRTVILDWAVNQYVANGWWVESRSPSQAVLRRDREVHHALHALLAFLTCLLWAPVWLVLAAVRKTERVVLTVGKTGHLQTVHGTG